MSNYFHMRRNPWIPKAQFGINAGTGSGSFGNIGKQDYAQAFKDYTGSMKFDGADSSTAGNKAKAIGAIGSAAAGLIRSVSPNNDIQPGDSQRANKKLEYTKNNGVEKGLGAALDVASTAFAPLAAASGALKVGSALSDVFDRKDSYGISKEQKGWTKILNPFGHLQDSINEGKKRGFGAFVKNFYTLGASGRDAKIQDRDRALNYDRWEEAQTAQGTNLGRTANHSVYAQNGGYIKRQRGGNIAPPRNHGGEGSVEVENGEIILGNPRTIEINSPNARASATSTSAMIVNGDKHNSDTDGDGKEGIRLTPNSRAYVASNYLTIEGKKARSGQKTVADEMKPLVKYLHLAEKHKNNPYLNNPIALEETRRQLDNIRKKAEANKFKQNLVEQSKKGDVASLMSYIADNAPLEDLDKSNASAVKNLIKSKNFSKLFGGNI